MALRRPPPLPQVNLTTDHRNIYGADAAAFLGRLKEVIENPSNLTL